MMKSLVARVVAGVVLLAVAGCSSGEERPAVEPAAEETTTTPAATQRPDVSLETSCHVLFGLPGKTFVEQISPLYVQESVSDAELETVRAGVEKARDVAATAQPELEAQLVAVADQVDAAIEAAHDGGGGSSDVVGVQTAALEVTRICREVL